MNLKAFSLNLLQVLMTSIVTSVMIVVGSSYINNKHTAENASQFSWLSSEESQETNLKFVEIKSLVLTLKNNTPKERYLLLDLALTTSNEVCLDKANLLLPKIKGITVDVLSSMEFGQVRNMSVMDLRKLMMERYRAAFQNINVTIPFDDVIISKMVFQ